jgi:Protein of unknown function (DUF3667)
MERPGETRCVNCANTMLGPFCHNCGEKKIGPKDFTFMKLLEQGFDTFTHLDSKFYNSFRSLLFKPGLLSSEYIKGKRKPYMKPFQVFFICNILFFIFLSTYDIYLIPSKWFFVDHYEGMSVIKLAKEVAHQKNISMESLALLYDAKVASLSKLLVICMVPAVALGSLLFGFRQQKEFGKHFIFAMHLVSFSLLLSVFWTRLAVIAPFQVTPMLYNVGVNFLFVIYIWFALKRFLQQSLWIRSLAAIFITLLAVGVALAYRLLISWVTLRYFV